MPALIEVNAVSLVGNDVVVVKCVGDRAVADSAGHVPARASACQKPIPVDFIEPEMHAVIGVEADDIVIERKTSGFKRISQEGQYKGIIKICNAQVTSR